MNSNKTNIFFIIYEYIFQIPIQYIMKNDYNNILIRTVGIKYNINL